MSSELIEEARRQADICNSCRYCESYCSVFPALHEKRSLADMDIVQLANLCHNCRGCFYACQYTAPHEFNINFPNALAEVRRESWEEFAWPRPVARAFHRKAWPSILAIMLGFILIFGLTHLFGNLTGNSFYQVLSHSLMLSIFMPAFIFPFIALGLSLRRYWKRVGGKAIKASDIVAALKNAGTGRELAAGHKQGCNFEDEDRFSHARRYAHQAIMYGFLLCLASTSSGTILHYVFNMPAPYSLISIPKILGVPGGILLVLGCGYMMALKKQSNPNVGDPQAWNGDMAFIGLLGFVALTGLILWIGGNSPATPWLLIIHLAAVFAFFISAPYSKMTHGFYRLMALIRDAQRKG